MTANESLDVIVDVWAIDTLGGGSEMKLMTYTLTNARVVSIRSWAPNRSDTAAQTYPPAEEVAFTYQTILVTYGPKSVESQDNWNESTE
jgi:type VI secretion system Hcp family effector